MSAGDLEYGHPADDIVGAITPTIDVGTVATGYSLDWLYDGDPQRPVKFNETTISLTWDYGIDVTPDFALLVHANLVPGLVAQYRGNDSASFAGPVLYTIDFPAASYHEDDFPMNLGADLRTDPPPACRFWNLFIDANSLPIAIKQFRSTPRQNSLMAIVARRIA